MLEELTDFGIHWFKMLGYVTLVLLGVFLVIFVFSGIVAGVISIVSNDWPYESPRWVFHLWGLFSLVTLVTVFTWEN